MPLMPADPLQPMHIAATTLLTRDMHVRSLVVEPGALLLLNGYRITVDQRMTPETLSRIRGGATIAGGDL